MDRGYVRETGLLRGMLGAVRDDAVACKDLLMSEEDARGHKVFMVVLLHRVL